MPLNHRPSMRKLAGHEVQIQTRRFPCNSEAIAGLVKLCTKKVAAGAVHVVGVQILDAASRIETIWCFVRQWIAPLESVTFRRGTKHKIQSTKHAFRIPSRLEQPPHCVF